MDSGIPYGRQHVTEEDIKAVTKVLKADYLTTGPKVREFEEKFADYVGAKYAVAVSNGTAALHLCALALGVNEKSKVITTPITFAASANCIRYCGGQVDFCDIDPSNVLLDVNEVRKKLEAAPKGTYQGIIPVDFAGYPVNMEAFKELADEHGLWIIEDACHAPGASFCDSHGENQFCGNGQYADLAIFSFHPVKHIACGEGGMVTMDDENLYQKIRQLRTHGMVYQGDPNLHYNHGGWYMEMQELGYNYRISDILCALGISQLSRMDTGIERRRQIAEKYNEEFNGTNISTFIPETRFSHAYHLYVVEVENRKELYEALRDERIYAQVHYVPLHTMPYYRQFGSGQGDMPKAEAYYEKCISLPMYPTLTDGEQESVIKTVLEVSG